MDGPSVSDIVARGLVHHVIPLSRSGKNPIQELHSVYALWRLFRQLRPAIVHAVTIKPLLYVGIAARIANVPALVAAIRSEEHTSELQSLMRISYAVFSLTQKKDPTQTDT